MTNLISCYISIDGKEYKLLDEHDKAVMQIVTLLSFMENYTITFTIHFDYNKHLVIKYNDWIIMQEVIMGLLDRFKFCTNHLSVALDIQTTAR